MRLRMFGRTLFRSGERFDAFANPQLNHHTEVVGGVLADECGAALKSFFAERRRALREARLARDPASGT